MQTRGTTSLQRLTPEVITLFTVIELFMMMAMRPMHVAVGDFFV